MSLKDAIQNIWASDYTQKNPNKAYKVSYANEYAAVGAFINGGPEPDWSGFSKLGKGLCEAEKERRLASQPEPEPEPEPPTQTVTAPANLASVQSAAQAGAVIALSGSFGNQTFTARKKVTFVGKPGASLGDVSFACGSGQIELKDLKVGVVNIGVQSVAMGGSWPASASDITLRNLDGTRFWVAWAERTRIYGGDWGLTTVQQAECRVAPQNPYDGPHVPTDCLIDGAYVHDFGMPSPGTHSDGIQTWGFNGLVIRNCTFERCGGTGAITIQAVFEPETAYQWPMQYFPYAAHMKVYGNKSLDDPGEYPVGHMYHAYYDVQGEVGLPGVDYAAMKTSNTFPRRVYVYGRNGSPAADNGPSQRPYQLPNPPPPPNWPPA